MPITAGKRWKDSDKASVPEAMIKEGAQGTSEARNLTPSSHGAFSLMNPDCLKNKNDIQYIKHIEMLDSLADCPCLLFLRLPFLLPNSTLHPSKSFFSPLSSLHWSLGSCTCQARSLLLPDIPNPQTCPPLHIFSVRPSHSDRNRNINRSCGEYCEG